MGPHSLLTRSNAVPAGRKDGKAPAVGDQPQKERRGRPAIPPHHLTPSSFPPGHGRRRDATPRLRRAKRGRRGYGAGSRGGTNPTTQPGQDNTAESEKVRKQKWLESKTLQKQKQQQQQPHAVSKDAK
uniref:Uncharacterized protein n=1 Tax=Oryza barthii TaxID=65489 RepID=A0A0D3FQR7_9ORYZ